jgi:hypothetical protein
MGAETIATLVVTAVIVAALAFYVLAIGLALRRLSLTLGTILIGLRAIRMQTAPLGAVLGDLNEDVDVIEDALEGVAGAVVTAQAPPEGTGEPLPSGPAGEEEPDPATTVEAPPEPSRALVRIEPPRQEGRGRTAGSRSRRAPGAAGRTAPRRRRPRPTPADMRAAIARAGEKMSSER